LTVDFSVEVPTLYVYKRLTHEGVKQGYSFKKRLFFPLLVCLAFKVKTLADKLRHAAYHNKRAFYWCQYRWT